jgi:hypothetical protein
VIEENACGLLGATSHIAKDHYYSLNHRAEALGYSPGYSSIDALRCETAALLARAC